MMLMLNVHPSRIGDIVIPDRMATTPTVPVSVYRDAFGNLCSRILAPQGRITVTSNAVIKDDGVADPQVTDACQHPVEELPHHTLKFLLGSRYCETDLLSEIAWQTFGRTEPGWSRVAAVCEFVHRHIEFGYEHGRPTKTALEAYRERAGVCRDYTHLAVAFCRALNIPARYCTGYLSDVGVPPPYEPMDFAAWFEAYLGGEWRTFDPRNLVPRRGRVLIARGRDAADVAISNTFGPCTLEGFEVWTDEIRDAPNRSAQPSAALARPAA
jgi:transglutaminase-like putative cysteine protease